MSIWQKQMRNRFHRARRQHGPTPRRTPRKPGAALPGRRPRPPHAHHHPTATAWPQGNRRQPGLQNGPSSKAKRPETACETALSAYKNDSRRNTLGINHLHAGGLGAAHPRRTQLTTSLATAAGQLATSQNFQQLNHFTIPILPINSLTLQS